MTTMTARARRTDIKSSHEAAASVNVGPFAYQLLAQFAKRSMTAEEANFEIGPRGLPGYWKRVSDLKEAGYIEHRGARAGRAMYGVNLSGRKAAVWIITPEGRAALKESKKGN